MSRKSIFNDPTLTSAEEARLRGQSVPTPAITSAHEEDILAGRQREKYQPLLSAAEAERAGTPNFH